MIIEKSFEQGSPEWHNARVANPGVSNLSKIITSTGKPSTQRKTYLHQMAGEKILGKKEESFSSPAMSRGTEMEPEARSFFQIISGLEVEEVALCYANELKQYHCSPDGLLVGRKAGLEIKNPLLSTHIGYLDRGVLPTTYKLQVMGSMAITGYESWHFFSNYPGIKPLWIEVHRDESLINIIIESLQKFVYDMNELVKKLK